MKSRFRSSACLATSPVINPPRSDPQLRKPSGVRGRISACFEIQGISRLIKLIQTYSSQKTSASPKITTPCYRFEKIGGQSRSRALTVFS
jgi:hypothetical protein